MNFKVFALESVYRVVSSLQENVFLASRTEQIVRKGFLAGFEEKMR